MNSESRTNWSFGCRCPDRYDLRSVWIGAALAIVGFFGIVIMNGWDTALGVIVTAPFTQMDNYTTTAIPMFTLMGMIIAETSIGRNLFDLPTSFLVAAEAVWLLQQWWPPV